jgi:hypothetical protein
VKYSNRFDVPEPLASCLKFKDRGPRDPNRVSVTTLVNPPRITVLRERHEEEVELDLSENLWMFLGSMGHAVVEDVARDEDLSEEKLTLDCDEFTVVGIPDLYRDGTIDDYKVTTVWSWIYDIKPEWVEQLNMYAVLMRHAGFCVDKLRIVMILRDWQKSKAKTEPGYPDCPVMTVEIPLWDEEKTMGHICMRLGALKAARELPDDELPVCTDEQRWLRDESYAVMKKGGKKASKVFKVSQHDDAESAATLYAKDKGDAYYVEHRPGVSVRCQDYCSVAPFCNFWKEANNE